MPTEPTIRVSGPTRNRNRLVPVEVVVINFADGERSLPYWAVTALGGVEHLTALLDDVDIRDSFESQTYVGFIGDLQRAVEANGLNRIQKNIIAAATGVRR